MLYSLLYTLLFLLNSKPLQILLCEVWSFYLIKINLASYLNRFPTTSSHFLEGFLGPFFPVVINISCIFPDVCVLVLYLTMQTSLSALLALNTKFPKATVYLILPPSPLLFHSLFSSVRAYVLHWHTPLSHCHSSLSSWLQFTQDVGTSLVDVAPRPIAISKCPLP